MRMVFCNLNQKVERRKLRRYDAGQLLTLNREKLDNPGTGVQGLRPDWIVWWILLGRMNRRTSAAPGAKRFLESLSSWWNGMCMWCTGPWRKRRRPTYQP